MISLLSNIQRLTNRLNKRGKAMASMTASGFAGQVLPVLLLPVILRLYNVTEYGIASALLALVSIFSTLSCWRYDAAIVIARNERDAVNVCALSFLINIIMTTILAGLSFLASLYLDNLKIIAEIKSVLWLLPYAVFSIGLNKIWQNWSIRSGAFHTLAVMQVVQPVLISALQIVAALAYTPNAKVFLASMILARIATLAAGFGWVVMRNRHMIKKHLSLVQLKRSSYKFRHFPAHIFQTDFLNILSANLMPLILISTLGAYAAGLVRVAERVVLLPFSMITQSIWQVGNREVAHALQDDRRDILRRLHIFSCGILAFPIVSGMVYSHLCDEIFGKEWQELANVLPAFLIMSFINNTSNSISYFTAFSFFRQQSITNIMLLSLRLAALLVGIGVFGYIGTIWTYCSVSIAFYTLVTIFWGRVTGLSRDFILDVILFPLFSVLVFLPQLLLGQQGLVLSFIYAVIAAAVYYGASPYLFQRLGLSSKNMFEAIRI
jgi:O-antigen/teichoic acid export membrane protein